MREVGPQQVANGLTWAQAVAALRAALAGGFDPEADPPRTIVPTAGGALIAMPSAAAGHLVTKLVTVGGTPHVQGTCVVFDPGSLAPVALVDGAALTLLRTPAVSALAVSLLVAPGPRRLLVLGRGPQADAHVAALRATQPTIDRVDVVGRERPGDFDALLAAADVVVCATSARTPLFDGARVGAEATVVAMGAHDPEAREVDDALAARATVAVESRASAAREAGAVLLPRAAGALDERDVVTLAELVAGRARPAPGRPRLFVSTGMSWEDAVVAGALVGPPG